MLRKRSNIYKRDRIWPIFLNNLTDAKVGQYVLQYFSPMPKRAIRETDDFPHEWSDHLFIIRTFTFVTELIPKAVHFGQSLVDPSLPHDQKVFGLNPVSNARSCCK